MTSIKMGNSFPLIFIDFDLLYVFKMGQAETRLEEELNTQLESNTQRIRVFVAWSCTVKVVSFVIGAGQMG